MKTEFTIAFVFEIKIWNKKFGTFNIEEEQEWKKKDEEGETGINREKVCIIQ